MPRAFVFKVNLSHSGFQRYRLLSCTAEAQLQKVRQRMTFITGSLHCTLENTKIQVREKLSCHWKWTSGILHRGNARSMQDWLRYHKNHSESIPRMHFDSTLPEHRQDTWTINPRFKAHRQVQIRAENTGLQTADWGNPWFAIKHRKLQKTIQIHFAVPETAGKNNLDVRFLFWIIQTW